MTSELGLLEAWRAGDKDAGEQLIAKHMHAIYRFFRHKLPNAAADLAQQTFLGCVESRERIDPTRSFRAYLFGIARNRLLLHLRTLQRKPDPAPLPELSLAETTGASPSGIVHGREEQRLLLHALHRIPLDFQIALELYYWEDLAVAEIAVVQQVAEGTVRSRLTRARELLRARLEEAEADPAIVTSAVEGLEHWARSLRDVGDS
jgi:RNA polymerase sigma-70 factor (ECF subfamily)